MSLVRFRPRPPLSCPRLSHVTSSPKRYQVLRAFLSSFLFRVVSCYLVRLGGNGGGTRQSFMSDTPNRAKLLLEHHRSLFKFLGDGAETFWDSHSCLGLPCHQEPGLNRRIGTQSLSTLKRQHNSKSSNKATTLQETRMPTRTKVPDIALRAPDGKPCR